MLLNCTHWNYAVLQLLNFCCWIWLDFCWQTLALVFRFSQRWLIFFFLLFQQLDEVVRQRNLHSLELFLSCAQKQLNVLLKEEPTPEENRDWHSQCCWYSVICEAANLHPANDEFMPIFSDCVIKIDLKCLVEMFVDDVLLFIYLFYYYYHIANMRGKRSLGEKKFVLFRICFI